MGMYKLLLFIFVILLRSYDQHTKLLFFRKEKKETLQKFYNKLAKGYINGYLFTSE